MGDLLTLLSSNEVLISCWILNYWAGVFLEGTTDFALYIDDKVGFK